MNVLAVETSCDDTSVAVVNSDRKVLSCIVADQNNLHAPFGGIVPEIASRNHSHHLLPIIDQALTESKLTWEQIDGLAVTNRPGLVGSLIVGLVTVKTLAMAKKIPFIGVHHIEGHIAAPFLSDDTYQGPTFFNDGYLALIVSGGHTSLFQVKGFGHYQLLGETIDDAAGEAFDKFAKVMGLPYPGGVHIDRLAQLGDDQAFTFPRPMLHEGFEFSFSGLKTAGHRIVDSLDADELKKQQANLAASYQRAIVDVLLAKVKKAVKETQLNKLIISGGVSANSLIRNDFVEFCQKNKIQLAIPPLRYCTDNAAMIGLAGLWRMQNGEFSDQNLPPMARAPIA